MVADLRKMQENQWVSEIRIDKPEFTVDETFDAQFPAKRFCRVVIELQDGTVYRSDAIEPRGEPKDHVDNAWLAEKIRRITAPVLTADAQEAFLLAALSPETATLREIVDGINRPENWLG